MVSEETIAAWSSPPVDDVGYVSSASMLKLPDDDLFDLVVSFERTRYQGWRNWNGNWRRGGDLLAALRAAGRARWATPVAHPVSGFAVNCLGFGRAWGPLTSLREVSLRRNRQTARRARGGLTGRLLRAAQQLCRFSPT